MAAGVGKGVGVTPGAGVGRISMRDPCTPKKSAIADRDDGTTNAAASATAATIAAAIATARAGVGTRRGGACGRSAAIAAATRWRSSGAGGYVIVAAMRCTLAS